MTYHIRHQMRHSRLLVPIVLAVALALTAWATPARADTTSATPITAIPYSDAVDFSSAAADTEATDCTYGLPTVWYTYTATSDQALVANASITTHSHISVFTGSPGSLSAIVCDSHPPTLFEITAGQTVYIAVVDIEGVGGVDTFTLQLAPPPFDIELTLNGVATLGSIPGTVIVSGTVTCNNDAEFVEVSGSLRQKQGLAVARGDFYVNSTCSSTPTSWTATVDGGTRIFLTKAATLSAVAFGCDGFTCDSDTETRAVRVRRG